MAIPWASIKSLLLFFGPVLLPKAISYYRSSKRATRSAGLSVRPAPRAVRSALAFLALLAALLVIQTLPPWTPENIFQRTGSRLQIPVDVLFSRLAALRRSSSSATAAAATAVSLTPTDAVLRAKFLNLESRLLYLQFGPAVIADCPFCHADEPKSYLYYALPGILLWPHLCNLVAVAVATSPAWTGAHGGQWRAWATVATLAAAAADVWAVAAHDHRGNARALRVADLDSFYWDARSVRLRVLAVLDAALALAIWLSATHRAFVRLPSPADRVDAVNRALHAVKSKTSALGIIKNTAQRDPELRARCDAYWRREGRLMADALEERDVIDGISDALENRLDMQTMTRDADTYTATVLQGLNEKTQTRL